MTRVSLYQLKRHKSSCNRWEAYCAKVSSDQLSSEFPGNRISRNYLQLYHASSTSKEKQHIFSIIQY